MFLRCICTICSRISAISIALSRTHFWGPFFLWPLSSNHAPIPLLNAHQLSFVLALASLMLPTFLRSVLPSCLPRRHHHRRHGVPVPAATDRCQIFAFNSLSTYGWVSCARSPWVFPPTRMSLSLVLHFGGLQFAHLHSQVTVVNLQRALAGFFFLFFPISVWFLRF